MTPFLHLASSRVRARGAKTPRERTRENPIRRALLATLLAALASPAFADSGILQDPTLTPGAVRTIDVSTSRLRHWDRARDDSILGEYGLPPGPHPDYEIDHLIPLGIGGADDDKNLWPEPRRSIEPTYNAEAKDRLEWKLRDLVCSGELDVSKAQQAIADDWTEAYRRYVRAGPLARDEESENERN